MPVIALNFSIQEKENSIRKDSYVLTSPLAIDSVQDDFYEVKRFALPPGNYTLKIELIDVLNDSRISAEKEITIVDFASKPTISEIEIAEYSFKSDVASSFQKAGIHIVPLISNFFSTEITRIPLYFEVYNSQVTNDSLVGILCKIIDTENEKELKENLADQMLEANGNSDQQEVERLGMEYKNIYIEVRNKAKREFWDHVKNNWKIASFLIVFLFVINYLLSGRITLFHKSNN